MIMLKLSIDFIVVEVHSRQCFPRMKVVLNDAYNVDTALCLMLIQFIHFQCLSGVLRVRYQLRYHPLPEPEPVTGVAELSEYSGELPAIC